MATKKKSTKRVATRSVSSPKKTSSSGMTHSHPMYGYIALGIVVIALFYLLNTLMS